MSKKRKNGQSTSSASVRRKAHPLTEPGNSVREKYAFLDDFFTYNWQDIPPRHAFGIYALSVFAGFPDYVEIAEVAITEGGDDRGVDFCYLDLDEQRVFIGQSYVAEEWGSEAAPARKADGLLNGLSWLLKSNIDEIPSAIREKAQEIQDAIRQNQVQQVYLLFTHNCMEAKSVEVSLRGVKESAATLLQRPEIEVHASQLGLPSIQSLYDASNKRILVEGRVEFDCERSFAESGDGWRAISTTISGKTLHELWEKHGDRLCSANIRGFLKLGRKGSVNRGILETIQHEPSQFWVYNNGITILTKKIELNGRLLTAHGVSVINGAQTTGVIGDAPPTLAARINVPCRFVECTDQRIVDLIIERNNTQNEIKSFDLRSNDETQRRLDREFGKYGIKYVHRREGVQRLPAGTIQAEVVGPFLAAFHGYFDIATRQRRSIFEDRSTYSRLFNREIAAEHVYLVQCLADAIGRIKQHLREQHDTGKAMDHDMEMYDVMKHSTSKFFVIGIVGELSEMIVGRKLVDRYSWRIVSNRVKPDRDGVIGKWRFCLDSLLPLIASNVNGNAYESVRASKSLKEVAKKVSAQIQAIRRQVDKEFAHIRDWSET